MKQHQSCGVSGKRLWGAFTRSRTSYSSTPAASPARGSARFGLTIVENRCSPFPPLVTEEPWRRRMVPGPAEPCGLWGPAQISTLHRLNDPNLPRRYQQQQPAGDRMSSSPEESHSRGGGSERDLKMASSSNTSPEGGPPAPLHQNRIRQVGVRPPPCAARWPAQKAV